MSASCWYPVSEWRPVQDCVQQPRRLLSASAAPTLCTEYGPNGWMDGCIYVVLAAILFFNFEAQKQYFSLVSYFFHNEHTQNRFKSLVTDFYSKMSLFQKFGLVYLHSNTNTFISTPQQKNPKTSYATTTEFGSETTQSSSL